ncbi:MAG: glycosyl transferase, partial [Crocinitomicaceae bacterium]|nr:glycosyl transferase [Crocinitomicaceae bacterium]
CTVSENKNQDSTLFENDHVRLVFAGGNGPWQSFYDVCNLLEDYLTKDITAEVLFLAQNNEQIKALKKKFPNRIKIDWVNPVEVQDLLKKCDYGLLLRKEIVTNQVASPVKFAEYLQAGLKVLISPGIGDFSFFVEDNQCGEVIKGLIPDLNPLTKAEREKSIQLCNKYFVKDSEQISKNYYALIQALQ